MGERKRAANSDDPEGAPSHKRSCVQGETPGEEENSDCLVGADDLCGEEVVRARTKKEQPKQLKQE